MVRALSFRFQEFCDSFLMFLVEGSSETGLLRHLCNHFSQSWKIHQLRGSSFLWKRSKLNLNLQNTKEKKKWEKVFRFWDNYIWNCCNKLPLLRREYLSWAVNGLTNSSKILHINQLDFFNTNFLHRDQ